MQEITHLDAVPETLLWTLHHRAVEAARPDAVLGDPMAVELVERIDFPFVERFGDGRQHSQWQGLRARAFDDQIGRFLNRHPGGTVVALGEGLETQSWRVDNGSMQWISVDLPEVIDLRRKLLPGDERRKAISSSVTEHGWLEQLAADSDAVLFTAQGLLMYLERSQVHNLVRRLASCLQQSSYLLFDAIPPWLKKQSGTGHLQSAAGYRPPRWSWALDRREARALTAIAGVTRLRRVDTPRGRGLLYGALLPGIGRMPALRWQLLTVWHMTFEDGRT
jgi:O-methyltransferase involved in polyketide biosynthesis